MDVDKMVVMYLLVLFMYKIVIHSKM